MLNVFARRMRVSSWQNFLCRCVAVMAMLGSTAHAQSAPADVDASGSTSITPQQIVPHLKDTADFVRIVSIAHDDKDEDEVIVTVRIEPGYHIYANHGATDYLIATTLSLAEPAPIQVIYPESVRFKPTYVDQWFDVYENTVRIVAIFSKGDLMPSSRVHGKLVAQACTALICLPPAEIRVAE